MTYNMILFCDDFGIDDDELIEFFNDQDILSDEDRDFIAGVALEYPQLEWESALKQAMDESGYSFID